LFSLQIGINQAQLNILVETSMGGKLGAHTSFWCQE